MSDTQYPAAPSPQPPAYEPQGTPPQPAEKPAKNVLGLVALIVAVVGFIFACIPGAFILGWVLLPVAFVLGIVAVCLRGKAKWQGITAIIVSVVGTIVAFIVFFAVLAIAVGQAVDDASGGDTTAVSYTHLTLPTICSV